MKLTPEQVSTIEALLTLREKGISNTEIGKRLGLGKFGQQKASGAFAVLDAMGLPVRYVGKGGPGIKRRRAAVAAPSGAPKAARRVFLSASQWEERLSSLGH